MLSSLRGCTTRFFFFPFSFSFPLPFAFRETTHRVRRGQTSLWNNNGVVLGKLPMQRPVWKKKKKRRRRERNSVLFPILLGNIHQGAPAVLEGSSPIAAHPLTGWDTPPLPRASEARSAGWGARFRKTFFYLACPLIYIAVIIGMYFEQPVYMLLTVVLIFLIITSHNLTASALGHGCNCYYVLNVSSDSGCYWARRSVSTGKPNKWVTVVSNTERLGSEVISWNDAASRERLILMKLAESGYRRFLFFFSFRKEQQNSHIYHISVFT